MFVETNLLDVENSLTRVNFRGPNLNSRWKLDFRFSFPKHRDDHESAKGKYAEK